MVRQIVASPTPQPSLDFKQLVIPTNERNIQMTMVSLIMAFPGTGFLICNLVKHGSWLKTTLYSA